MKLSNTVVSVIIIVAVLVSAYALGLLIRRARTGRPADSTRQTSVVSQKPGEGRMKDTPEERAKIKDLKAQAIEKVSTMTPEQKQKFREQIRKQAGARPPDKGTPGVPSVQPGTKTSGKSPAEAGGQNKDVNAPVPPADSTAPKPAAEKTGAESVKPGPG